MEQPLIGLTPMFDEKKSRYILPAEYMRAVAQSGGIPLILPVCASLDAAFAAVSRLSGIFFTGGEDISPELYGEERTELCGTVNVTRDESERLLFLAAHELGLPTLGVCRGMQLINALLGGSLYQDIPASSVNHMMEPPYDRCAHAVSTVHGTPLAELCERDGLSVNSYHHQAVKKLAPGLQLMAQSPDGLAEAAFAPQSRFLWLFQWHPETLFGSDDASRDIFRRFVREADSFGKAGPV